MLVGEVVVVVGYFCLTHAAATSFAFSVCLTLFGQLTLLLVCSLSSLLTKSLRPPPLVPAAATSSYALLTPPPPTPTPTTTVLQIPSLWCTS